MESGKYIKQDERGVKGRSANDEISASDVDILRKAYEVFLESFELLDKKPEKAVIIPFNKREFTPLI